MRIRIGPALQAIAAVCTLSISGATVHAATAPGNGGPAPPPNALCRGTSSDWYDFLKIEGRTYYGHYGLQGGPPLASTAIGSKYARVTAQTSTKPCGLNATASNGNAAYLAPGTALYRVKGYRPSFRLVARTKQGLDVYQVADDPSAKWGSDLLDIAGKVASISMEIPGSSLPIGVVTGQSQITSVVTSILRSPVHGKEQVSRPPRYILTFHLRDGTSVSEKFWWDVNLLSGGITVPSHVRQTLGAAIVHRLD